MNEWEFTALATGWINEIISKKPHLHFGEARCEQTGTGSNKRRDLSLLDRHGNVVLTGEIKLPFRKPGVNPHNHNEVKQARRKARRAGSDFFFTWNVNQFLLWETAPQATRLTSLNYKSWDVTNIANEYHLDQKPTHFAIRKWLELFLEEFAAILRGTADLGHKTPDEKFVESLEAALERPVALTLEGLFDRYNQRRFKTQLDKWMRDEQGWIIFDNPEGIRENLERASKFACYALVNKIIFHEALLKRYRRKMDFKRPDFPYADFYQRSSKAISQHLLSDAQVNDHKEKGR